MVIAKGCFAVIIRTTRAGPAKTLVTDNTETSTKHFVIMFSDIKDFCGPEVKSLP